jgi:hypothetical protein
MFAGIDSGDGDNDNDHDMEDEYDMDEDTEEIIAPSAQLPQPRPGEFGLTIAGLS